MAAAKKPKTVQAWIFVSGGYYGDVETYVSLTKPTRAVNPSKCSGGCGTSYYQVKFPQNYITLCALYGEKLGAKDLKPGEAREITITLGEVSQLEARPSRAKKKKEVE